MASLGHSIIFTFSIFIKDKNSLEVANYFLIENCFLLDPFVSSTDIVFSIVRAIIISVYGLFFIVFFGNIILINDAIYNKLLFYKWR